MGFFSDILDTIGLGDVGSAVDAGASADDVLSGSADFNPDLGVGENASGFTGDATDLVTGGNNGGNVDLGGTGGGDSSSSLGGFGGSALKAVGSAISATAASSGSTNMKINQVTPHYLQTPLDTKGTTGKANRAPVADPQAIWNQWENRLTYFVGNKK